MWCYALKQCSDSRGRERMEMKQAEAEANISVTNRLGHVDAHILAANHSKTHPFLSLSLSSSE